MNNLFNDNQKALITLPARNDEESEIITNHKFSGGILKFEGQEFIFPDGFDAEISAQWIESDNLLLCGIFVEAVVEAECARCLKPVDLDLSGNLMYLYCLNEPELIEDDEYLPVEVEHFGRVLDVMPQIMETIYTLIPTKILCKPDCKGLCPECGANLNDGECSCKNINVDPRFESLKNFMNQ